MPPQTLAASRYLQLLAPFVAVLFLAIEASLFLRAWQDVRPATEGVQLTDTSW